MGIFTYFKQGLSVEIGSYHTRFMKNGVMQLDEISQVEYCDSEDKKIRHYFASGIETQGNICRWNDTYHLLRPVNGLLVDYEAVVFMLREFKKRLPAAVPRRLLIAVPSFATGVDSRAYKETIEMTFGGVFRKQYAVSAPIAAVAGLGYDVFDDSVTHCIIDVGREMSSFSLVCGGKTLAVEKNGEAGQAFDDKIMEYFKTNGLLIGPRTAENAKKLLSRGENEYEVRGRNVETGIPECRTFERKEAEHLFDSSYNKLVECFNCCLKENPTPEKPIKYHLIGGASQTIGLKAYLEKATQYSFCMPEEPDKVIIKGLDKLNAKENIKRLSEFGSLV